MFIDVEVQMILYIYKKIIVSRAGHDSHYSFTTIYSFIVQYMKGHTDPFM